MARAAIKGPSITRNDCFSVPELKDRGWTVAGINRFLGDHDIERPNPHSKKSGPMRFYERSRVLETEQGEEWQSWLIASLARRESAKKGVETRLDRFLDAVRDLPIPLEVGIPRDELTARARRHHQRISASRSDRAEQRDDFFDAPPASGHGETEDQFLRRIIGNYLRHQCSGYHSALSAIRGEHGKDDAYWIIREKVDEAVHAAYPFLKDES